MAMSDQIAVHLPSSLTRRAVLLGGASAFALAACSSKSSGSTSETTLPKPTASLLAFFPLNDYITAQVPQRIAFGVANPGGGMSTNTPSSLVFTIAGPGGSHTTKTVAAHRKDLPWAYYPIEFTPAKAGNHTVSATVDGDNVTATFAVGAKGSSDVPGPTDKLPSMKTPTTTDHLGVKPICTQDPPCPLHTISLDAALKAGKPVAYLVATPKFCQTGVCGPVLDVLQSVTKRYEGRVTFIHQEVYQSAAQAAEKGTAAKLTDAVTKLNLTSEPVLFITGRDGVISHRLDAAFDANELGRALDAALA